MVESRAAVAVQAGKPLEVTTIQVEGPREGEVMIEMWATGVCHTDAFDLMHEGKSIRSVIEF